MTMPAGKYYVGDLCYVLHDEWHEVCDITSSGNDCLEGEFTLKDGRRFATYSTKFGDGLYYDNYGNKYPVDAGLIGCVLLDAIDLTNTANDLSLGNIVEFADDFETSGGRLTSNEWNGIIRIGRIEVETDPVYDDYECDEYDD